MTEDASGILHLTVDKNVVSGGNVQAPDVFFNYTVTDSLGHTAVATADIKAINVTPGNNALDLTGLFVNPYNFSYVDGTKGSDTFKGGAGNDTFVGGAGGDSFSGGTGNDTFKYTAITDSQPGSGKFDTISDFTHGSDKIDFSAISGLNSTVQSVTVNNL
ncbi:Ca2+-binding RTX toxin-like protein [Bradyrhizobium sp. AZCC 2289]